jgi:hypothetical protein
MDPNSTACALRSSGTTSSSRKSSSRRWPLPARYDVAAPIASAGSVRPEPGHGVEGTVRREDRREPMMQGSRGMNGVPPVQSPVGCDQLQRAVETASSKSCNTQAVAATRAWRTAVLTSIRFAHPMKDQLLDHLNARVQLNFAVARGRQHATAHLFRSVISGVPSRLRDHRGD